MTSSDPATSDVVDLVVRAQSGDQSAMARLIELSQMRVFKFCLVLVGSRELAEELTQDCFLKALQNITRLKKPEAWTSWLFQISKNLFLDHARSKSEVRDSEVELEDIADVSTDQIHILAVHQVLSQFESTEDRLLLLLIDMEGRSYRETAEIIGISEDAVRSRLHRLRQFFLEKWQLRETK